MSLASKTKEEEKPPQGICEVNGLVIIISLRLFIKLPGIHLIFCFMEASHPNHKPNSSAKVLRLLR
jgi:hypothetical protein